MKSKGERPEGLLLDTHIWYWYGLGISEIDKKAQAHIMDMASQGALYLSAITLWEISMLVAKGRMKILEPLPQWFEGMISNTAVTLIPLSISIAADTAALPKTFHGDPSDRLIAATARVHNLSLMTRDKLILRHAESGYLRCVAA